MENTNVGHEGMVLSPQSFGRLSPQSKQSCNSEYLWDDMRDGEARCAVLSSVYLHKERLQVGKSVCKASKCCHCIQVPPNPLPTAAYGMVSH
jgi:hypothetical protein